MFPCIGGENIDKVASESRKYLKNTSLNIEFKIIYDKKEIVDMDKAILVQFGYTWRLEDWEGLSDIECNVLRNLSDFSAIIDNINNKSIK